MDNRNQNIWNIIPAFFLDLSSTVLKIINGFLTETISINV